MENKLYAYWLCSVPGVGNRSIEKLQEAIGSAEQIYHAEEEWAKIVKAAQAEEMQKHKQEWNLQEEYNKMHEKGIRFLLKEEKDYPERLLHIPDAPMGIFLKGHLPAENKMSVAIIGARDCSEYGKFVAEELGKCLGKNEVQVISGMARGIDGISQSAALRAGGTSVAVLGSGVDVCYPAQNRTLYEDIQKQGGVLSIYPPGTPARPQNFPPRNRIVSGLSDVVVVIEARQKSGTLITVDMALEQGKEVYVVPGRITDRLSDGCNRLLKQGAELMLSPEEFLIEIKELWEKRKQGTVNFEKAEIRTGETGKIKVGKTGIKTGETEKAGISTGETEKAETGIGETEKAEIRTGETEKAEIRTGETEKAEIGIGEIGKTQKTIPPGLQQVYDILDFYPQSMEQLLDRLPKHYTIAYLNTALMQLCLEKQALQVSPGYFCLSNAQGPVSM